MLYERNWDGCSIFFFAILYLLPGIRLQSGWSVFTSAFPLSLSLPVLLFPFWCPMKSHKQLNTVYQPLSCQKKLYCFIYQCFESCDMKTWLVINIVLIPQTCFAIENRPCSQFSHAQLFLQKKEKSDYALIEKKVWIEVCIRSVFLVYGKRSSVLGSSFPPGYFHPGYFPSRRLNSNNKTKNCSRHWTYHPVSRLSIDSYMRERQSRSILHTNQTNLNLSPFSFETLSKCHNTFFEKIELGGRTFFFVHSLLLPSFSIWKNHIDNVEVFLIIINVTRTTRLLLLLLIPYIRV